MLIKPSPTLESVLCPSKALGSEANHGEYPLRFKNWLVQKRYSPNTIKTYTSALKVFLNHFSNRLPESLNDKDVEEFMLCRIVNAGLSHAYQNQMVNAVRLFFKAIVKSEINPATIERPRREYVLPNVLSKSEVKKILESLRNQKHRSMLSLIYACGLRRGELLNLKPEDVDSKRNLLKIRLAKGGVETEWCP
jgi:integrase/recombinase XerD